MVEHLQPLRQEAARMPNTAGQTMPAPIMPAGSKAPALVPIEADQGRGKGKDHGKEENGSANFFTRNYHTRTQSLRRHRMAALWEAPGPGGSGGTIFVTDHRTFYPNKQNQKVA